MMMGRWVAVWLMSEVEGLLSCVKIRESKEKKDMLQKAWIGMGC
jgi:hypothetical protein